MGDEIDLDAYLAQAAEYDVGGGTDGRGRYWSRDRRVQGGVRIGVGYNGRRLTRQYSLRAAAR